MKNLLIFGVLVYWLYEHSAAVAVAAVPTLNILQAGGNIPLASLSLGQLQQWVSEDVIAPDEADAILATGEGLAADANALANGVAKINAWISSGGS